MSGNLEISKEKQEGDSDFGKYIERVKEEKGDRSKNKDSYVDLRLELSRL